MGRCKIIDNFAPGALDKLTKKAVWHAPPNQVEGMLQAVPIPNEQRHSGSPESYAAPPKNN